MFGRGKRADARQALFDPEFTCTAPGVAGVRVAYDPLIWLRCPGVGQDRTDWRDRVLSAYAEDLRWPANCYERRALGEALDQIANDPLEHTANFAMIPPKLDEPSAVAYLDVADEELTLLEHGDPEHFLTFADIDPELKAKPRDFPGGWRWVSQMGSEDGGLMIQVRAHRLLDTDPPLHATGVGFCGRGKRSGQMIGLFARTRVRLTDGRTA